MKPNSYYTRIVLTTLAKVDSSKSSLTARALPGRILHIVLSHKGDMRIGHCYVGDRDRTSGNREFKTLWFLDSEDGSYQTHVLLIGVLSYDGKTWVVRLDSVTVS